MSMVAYLMSMVAFGLVIVSCAFNLKIYWKLVADRKEVLKKMTIALDMSKEGLDIHREGTKARQLALDELDWVHGWTDGLLASAKMLRENKMKEAHEQMRVMIIEMEQRKKERE